MAFDAFNHTADWCSQNDGYNTERAPRESSPTLARGDHSWQPPQGSSHLPPEMPRMIAKRTIGSNSSPPCRRSAFQKCHSARVVAAARDEERSPRRDPLSTQSMHLSKYRGNEKGKSPPRRTSRRPSSAQGPIRPSSTLDGKRASLELNVEKSSALHGPDRTSTNHRVSEAANFDHRPIQPTHPTVVETLEMDCPVVRRQSVHRPAPKTALGRTQSARDVVCPMHTSGEQTRTLMQRARGEGPTSRPSLRRSSDGPSASCRNLLRTHSVGVKRQSSCNRLASNGDAQSPHRIPSKAPLTPPRHATSEVLERSTQSPHHRPAKPKPRPGRPSPTSPLSRVDSNREVSRTRQAPIRTPSRLSRHLEAKESVLDVAPDSRSASQRQRPARRFSTGSTQVQATRTMRRTSNANNRESDRLPTATLPTGPGRKTVAAERRCQTMPRPINLTDHIQSQHQPTTARDGSRPVRRFSTGSTLQRSAAEARGNQPDPEPAGTAPNPRHRTGTSRSPTGGPRLHRGGLHSWKQLRTSLSVTGWDATHAYSPSGDADESVSLAPTIAEPVNRRPGGGGAASAAACTADDDDCGLRRCPELSSDATVQSCTSQATGAPCTSTIQIDLRDPSCVDFYFFKASKAVAAEPCR